METQVMEVLQSLANKLGVAITYLWSVMVKQAYINGVFSLIGSIIVIIISYLAYRYGKHLGQKAETVTNSEEQSTYFMGKAIMTAISIVLLIVVVPFMFFDGIRMLINPDYYAFKLILDALHLQ